MLTYTGILINLDLHEVIVRMHNQKICLKIGLGENTFIKLIGEKNSVIQQLWPLPTPGKGDKYLFLSFEAEVEAPDIICGDEYTAAVI